MRRWLVLLTITDDGVDITKAERAYHEDQFEPLYLLDSAAHVRNYVKRRFIKDAGIDITIHHIDESIP